MGLVPNLCRHGYRQPRRQRWLEGVAAQSAKLKVKDVDATCETREVSKGYSHMTVKPTDDIQEYLGLKGTCSNHGPGD